MEVGKIIKDARISKGMTQEELGKIVGVQKSAIAKYENGRVVNIKRSTLQKLALALGIKGSELIGAEWDNEIKKDPKAAGANAAALLLDQDFVDLYKIYNSLCESKKKQVKDFILFLSNQN